MNSVQHELPIAGCRSTPLAHYLKALGILRLVHRQADPAAAGYWQHGSFVLKSRLDREALLGFFLNDYAPSPILNPWNGGSGFYPDDGESALAMETLGRSDQPRWGSYRKGWEVAGGIIAKQGLKAKPEDATVKAQLLRRLRAAWSDEALEWMDTAITLGLDNDPGFPPLLGSGGNDGRFDFSGNFAQRLVELFLSPKSNSTLSKNLLEGSLFATPVCGLQSGAIGQFFPGAAGGPNATSGFDADGSINPWDFIFLMEGTLLLRAAITRRCESEGAGRVSAPMTFSASNAGAGSLSGSDAKEARAEIWLPIWNRPASLPEIQALFAEGRITLGRRAASNALDVTRALARLGVQRGIVAFERFGLLKRAGKAFLATPLGRLEVRQDLRVDLINELERGDFLRRLRKLAYADEAPQSLSVAVRALDEALFSMARQVHPSSIQNTLIHLGHALSLLALLPEKKDAPRPAPYLLSSAWLKEGNDASAEWELAVALAGVEIAGQPIRAQIFPLDPQSRFWSWKDSRPVLLQNLDEFLGQMLKNALFASKLESPGLLAATAISSDRLLAWLEGRVDTRRIAELLAGILAVEPGVTLVGNTAGRPLPAAYWLLKALWRQPDSTPGLSGEAWSRRSITQITGLLEANRSREALSIAWQAMRSRAQGPFPTVPHQCPDAGGLSGARLLSAMVLEVPPWQWQAYWTAFSAT